MNWNRIIGSGLIGLGLGLLIGVATSCTLTIPPAVIDAAQAALTNKPPAIVPPVVVAPPVADPGPVAVDTTGDLCDPNPDKYTPEYVAANASFEECHIEPATGLMIRTAFWRPSVGQWWLLSGLADGHIRRVGGNLVADTFPDAGITYVPYGFTKYEPQVNEKPEALKLFSKGGTSPYDGARQYCHWIGHKAK